MSRRLNVYGFSLGHMRHWFGSRDRKALRQIQKRVASDHSYETEDQLKKINKIIEQAIMTGVPFPELGQETSRHAIAATMLAEHDQDWLMTDAISYPANALEEGLWGQYRKLARPEIKALLRALLEGIPIFGLQPVSEGSSYAAVGLDKLRFCQPGLADLRDQIIYRVGRKRFPSPEDEAAAKFAADFYDWIEQIVQAEHDLWFTFD